MWKSGRCSGEIQKMIEQALKAGELKSSGTIAENSPDLIASPSVIYEVTPFEEIDDNTYVTKSFWPFSRRGLEVPLAQIPESSAGVWSYLRLSEVKVGRPPFQGAAMQLEVSNTRNSRSTEPCGSRLMSSDFHANVYLDLYRAIERRVDRSGDLNTCRVPDPRN